MSARNNRAEEMMPSFLIDSYKVRLELERVGNPVTSCVRRNR